MNAQINPACPQTGKDSVRFLFLLVIYPQCGGLTDISQEADVDSLLMSLEAKGNVLKPFNTAA